jgi:O-antigen/teichoic acid export membrane protein
MASDEDSGAPVVGGVAATAPAPDTAESKQATGGVGVLALGNYGTQGARLALSVVVSQLLGPAGRGAVALISVVDEASSALFTFGVPVAAGYRAKIGADSDKALVNASFRIGVALLPLTVGIALVAGLLALDALDPLARWLTVLLIAWTGIVNLPGLAAMNILQAHRRLRSLAVFPAIYPVVTLVVVLALAIAGHLTVAWVAIGFALGRLLTTVYGLVRTSWPSKGASASVRPLVGYGIRALPGTVGTLLNNRVDQLIIAPLVSLRELGFYAVAAGTSFLPTILALSVGSGAFSTIVDDGDLGRGGSASTAIRRGLLLSAIGAVALGGAVPVLIPALYGEAFTTAIVPAEILLVGSVAWGGQLVARQCANALGRPGDASLGEMVGLGTTVVGLLVAAPLFGIIGAAVVSVGAYVARFTVTVVLLRRVGVRHIRPGADDMVWLWRRAKRGMRRRA